MRIEDRQRVRRWAGLSRLVFGALAFTVFPVIHPGLVGSRVVFGAYLVIAAIFQVLIVIDIGDRPRALSGNVVDTLAITYMVQQIGSTTTAFVALYVFAAVVNTLAVGRRVGITAAIVASIAYGGVLGAEVLGYLPYAPASRHISTAPSALEAIAIWFVITMQLVLCAWIVGALVTLIRDREVALRDANERLESLARRDPLTDLWNRRHLMEQLDARLSSHGALSVVMIDLDGFKRVNDVLGHIKGDELLRVLARAIEAETGTRGAVFRVGGDEVLILLDDVGARASAFAEDVVRAVRKTASAFSTECRVTASVGLATVQHNDTIESIVKRADERAYAAKRAGGDRLVS